MEYSEHFAGHARIAILQLLAGQQELRLNTRLLLEAFDVMDLPEKYRRAAVSESSPGVLDIPENGVDFNTAVDSYENALIMRALEKTGWNRNQAALLLKLNRTTLVEKIKKKGLRPPEGHV